MSEKPVSPRRRARRHADAVIFSYIHALSPGLPHWSAEPPPQVNPAEVPAS
jgi:hypothetical protein